MQVQVSDIRADIAGGGSEIISFNFRNYEVLTDVSGNKMSQGKISGNLKPSEYVSKGKGVCLNIYR